jgi:hypothetical protein
MLPIEYKIEYATGTLVKHATGAIHVVHEFLPCVGLTHTLVELRVCL